MTNTLWMTATALTLSLIAMPNEVEAQDTATPVAENEQQKAESRASLSLSVGKCLLEWAKLPEKLEEELPKFALGALKESLLDNHDLVALGVHISVDPDALGNEEDINKHFALSFHTSGGLKNAFKELSVQQKSFKRGRYHVVPIGDEGEEAYGVLVSDSLLVVTPTEEVLNDNINLDATAFPVLQKTQLAKLNLEVSDLDELLESFDAPEEVKGILKGLESGSILVEETAAAYAAVIEIGFDTPESALTRMGMLELLNAAIRQDEEFKELGIPDFTLKAKDNFIRVSFRFTEEEMKEVFASIEQLTNNEDGE